MTIFSLAPENHHSGFLELFFYAYVISWKWRRTILSLLTNEKMLNNGR